MLILTDHEGDNHYLIGGTDQGREGSWYWANSLEPVEDFVWHNSEPNNGIEYNCMLYNHAYDSAEDCPCGVAYWSPLCQIPMEFLK